MPGWLRWALVGVALLALGWLVLTRLIAVVGMVAFALLLTSGLQPLVRWLDRRKVPHWLSVTSCFLAILGLFVLFGIYLVPVVIDQARQLADFLGSVAANWDVLHDQWANWRQRFPALVPSLGDVGGWVRDQLGGWVQRTVGLTGALVVLTVQVFTTLVLTFFFLKDGRRLLRGMLVVLPPEKRSPVPDLLERIGERIGDWVLGQFTLMLIIGVLSGVVLALLGVPFAILLGVMAGLLEAVPYVGPILAGALAVGVALTQSWTLALWVLGFFVLLQQLENQILQPVIVGRAVGLHPVWVILVLFVGGIFFGIPGMILAVPAAATVQILIDELYLPRIAAQEEALADGQQRPPPGPERHDRAA